MCECKCKHIDIGKIEGGEYCLIKHHHDDKWDIFGDNGRFELGINGARDWKDRSSGSYELFEKIWSISKNLVQWKGKQSMNR